MRFTITPLGGAARTVGQIVAGIVNYLQPKPPPTPAPDMQDGDGSGPSRYYADSGDGPGRWFGHGATELGLSGQVDAVDFAKVLAGRDPATGRRLITARGSAGRRADLGAGAVTRFGPDGEPWYGEHDAAAVLGISLRDVGRMLDVGGALAVSRLATLLAPGSVPVPVSLQPEGSYLVAVIDPDGQRWVTDTELTRCETARAAGITPDEILAGGCQGDLLPIEEAARLIGVTPRYLRGLAKRYETDRTKIDTAGAEGRRPRRAYLIAERGTKGRWFVTRQHLVEFIERRRPPAVRVGYDLTLTTEKSLGVLALLSDDPTRTVVLDAVQAGNDWAMAWLESHAAETRVAGKTVAVAGWTVASFQHHTSRALDPFPHHHNVIANTVTDSDGVRRALDARGLYRHAKAASALATAQMRYQLTTRLGVGWRQSAKGGWEIDGIPDTVLTEFSQRRNEIDDALHELETAIGRGATLDEVQDIVVNTRPPKRHTPAELLRGGWWERAASRGYTPDDLTRTTDRTIDISEPDTNTIFTAIAAPDGICTNLSVFNRGDLLHTLANHPIPTDNGGEVGVRVGPLIVTAERLEQVADGFLTSAHVINLGGDRYTTVAMLAVQQRIIDRYRHGLHRGRALVPPNVLDEALAAHAHLDSEQQGLVRAFCKSGHATQFAIGRAGSGKTTTMRVAVDAWTIAGYRVLGTAVKGEAARTLADATGIPTETLAWYLAHPDPQHSPLDAKTVLIVDEASTISDRDLDHLTWLASATGATLRLIGDPAQHGAVEAGGMYRVICEHHRLHTPELKTTHRLLDHHDQAAANALRDGDINTAFDHLEAAGHLHIIDNELDFHRDVLTRWWTAHHNGEHHPMVDRRNHTRQQLNRLAHTLLHANGDIGTDELHATDGRRYSTGDRVIARTPNRRLHPDGEPERYIRNGATGTVTDLYHGVEPDLDRLTINFDDLGTITVGRDFFDHHRLPGGRVDVGIDHAYAQTSYAVQGSTRHTSTSRIDPTATRAETYVDITRGRNANHLYLTNTRPALDGEQLPTLPPPPTDETVAARLKQSTGEITAWELHQAGERSHQEPQLVL